MALHGAASQQPRWTLSDHDNKNRGWFNIKPTSVRGFVYAGGGGQEAWVFLLFSLSVTLSRQPIRHTPEEGTAVVM